ncbi:MAG: hypothetical protein HRT87_08810 [Legionellales bacterium]|nr:hypothetical protein [Legionellales bacterium]
MQEYTKYQNFSLTSREIALTPLEEDVKLVNLLFKYELSIADRFSKWQRSIITLDAMIYRTYKWFKKKSRY